MGPLGMEILTRIGQNLVRDERAVPANPDSENQTADRGVGRHTARGPIAAVQRLRQSDPGRRVVAAANARASSFREEKN